MLLEEKQETVYIRKLKWDNTVYKSKLIIE